MNFYATILCNAVAIPALEALCGGSFEHGRDGALEGTVYEPGQDRGIDVRVDPDNFLRMDEDDDAELLSFERSIAVEGPGLQRLAREIFDLVSKDGPALLLADHSTVVARSAGPAAPATAAE